ncbi:MAG: hypothetical protein U0230_10095 [Polyangiales bacterium]
MTSPVRPILLPLLVLALVGCDDSIDWGTRAANACTPSFHGKAWTYDDATAPGPYTVGILDLTFVDSSRSTPAHGTYPGAPDRTLPTWIYYPASGVATGSKAADGRPFPIVLYSHGFSSTRSENLELVSHLASHGFIVIAPTFPVSNLGAPSGPSGIDLPEQPRDLTFLLNQALTLSATPGHPLEGAVDATRVAAAGVSLGGMTTLLVTYHTSLRDPRIDVAVAMAPVSGLFTPTFYEPSNAPLLVLHGDIDAILDYRVHAEAVRANAHAPRSLLTIAGGTHTGFTALSHLFEDATNNVDSVGCMQLTMGGSSDPNLMYSMWITSLGGAQAGVEQPATASAFCPATLPDGMHPIRQLSITSAAAYAFIASYLDADPIVRDRACAFSEHTLPEEPELTLDRK